MLQHIGAAQKAQERLSIYAASGPKTGWRFELL
jgi:hypothetical protein